MCLRGGLSLGNEVVKYDNLVNEFSFIGFTERDLDLFMTLCYEIKDEGTELLEFTYAEIKELINYKPTDLRRFKNELDRMSDKLSVLQIKKRDDKGFVKFTLFPTWESDLDSQTLTVRVNPDFAYLFNDVRKNFTRLELNEFIRLKSKYSKNLYRLLKQYRKSGVYRIAVDLFRERMGCPLSYSNKEFMRTCVTPAIKELSQGYFDNLKVTPIHDRKRGAPIIAYEFTFARTDQIIGQTYISMEQEQRTPRKKNKFKNFEERNVSKQALSDLERALLQKGKG